MKIKEAVQFASAVVLGLFLGAAQAATVVVSAIDNSTGGGFGADVFNVTSGQSLSISVPVTELWGAGVPYRISNAAGLSGDTFAVSGQTLDNQSIIGQKPMGYSVAIVAGTQLGQAFQNWSQNGITAPYGTLVASIGNVYQVIGTSFSGAAWGTGALKLWYFDENKNDNFGAINVTAAVPEPHEWAMMVAGLGVVGWVARRRQHGAASRTIHAV